MKIKLSSLILLFIVGLLQAQTDQILQDKVYRFKFGTEITECKADGKPILIVATGAPAGAAPSVPKTKIAEKDWKFEIDKVLGDKIVITFINWKNDNEESLLLTQRNNNFVLDDNNDRRYFFLSKEDLKSYAEVVPAFITIEFGTVTIPIKIRPGNGDNVPLDFYGNFNAGVGLNFKINKFASLYSGISITSVPVDSETTNGNITSATNAAALTPTLGLIKEVGKVQVGVFAGFDFLSRELGKNWIYQGRRWFGIGVGFNIFSVSSGKENADPQ
ncbi:hypothetical protein [Winogradskyella ouciana]|uniref:hypothetical protein n=1 Tax=Winogradskyella ouciana TaxID=2608631 RepID=UPI003D2768E7